MSLLFALRRSSLVFAGIASLAISGLTQPAQGEDLGEILEEVKWSGIVGTWVDSDSKGDQVKIVYAWKFEDKLIEVSSKMGDTEGVSLMGFNADSEEVFIVGGNNKGGASIGKWTMDGEDAVLDLSFVGPEGEKGKMTLKHHWVDKDTLEISGTTEEGGDPFTLTLVRSK